MHTWLAPGVVAAQPFMDVDEAAWAAGCEHSLEAAWWLARRSAEPLRATAGSLVFVVPTVGMAGAAEFAMLAAVAEGVRVLAKGCGRQWGVDGVTVNTIAAAPHHWLDADTGDALDARHLALDARVRHARRRGRRPRAVDRAARRSRRALPHRQHARRRRRHLDGTVSTGTLKPLLEGRTVVVTGAGGGVGRGIALACATHGANVVIAARRTETGDVVAERDRRAGW